MKTRIDPVLIEEAQRYQLRFCCEHCAYFDPDRERCSEGYPTDEHRNVNLLGDAILFCKLFEVGP